MKSKPAQILSIFSSGSAFTQRNVVSVGLVLFFFVIYVMAGGKITSERPDITRKLKSSVTKELPQILPNQKLSESTDKELLAEPKDEELGRREPLFAEPIREQTEEPSSSARVGLFNDLPKPQRAEVEEDEPTEEAPSDAMSALEQRLQRIRPKNE